MAQRWLLDWPVRHTGKQVGISTVPSDTRKGVAVVVVSPFILLHIGMPATIRPLRKKNVRSVDSWKDSTVTTWFAPTPALQFAPNRGEPTIPRVRPATPKATTFPMYLANMYFQQPNKWEGLQKALVEFGKAAGLFDEIAIRPLGKRNTEPFQIRIRMGGKRAKGPPRNLIDVGYGVSQASPSLRNCSVPTRRDVSVAATRGASTPQRSGCSGDPVLPSGLI